MNKNKTITKLIVLSTACILQVAAAIPSAAEEAKKSSEYPDFNPGDNDKGKEWVQVINIKSPQMRSDIKGDVKVEFQAPGMDVANAFCWQQPTVSEPNPAGHDAQLTPEIKLGADGAGAFVFPSDKFPNGPITIRIATSNTAKKRDLRELQLYNTGGVVWNQGIPKTDPPAAKGMKLAFSDDFDKPLSISNDGKGKRYQAHKPGPRNEDYSGYPFTGPEGKLNPFSQKGSYLRIHASKLPDGRSSTGIIAPVDSEGKGFLCKAPCYLECRFMAQSVPGAWPAFWTLTKGDWAGKNDVSDESDIIEAYGGMGNGNPNFSGYAATTHFWGSKGADGKPLPCPNRAVQMTEIGDKSTWSTKFHTDGVLVTKTDTVYFLDDIEVLRHPSGEPSKTLPMFFMINYAIGGISGWKIDLAREGNATDMWVDYVRVYQGQ